MGDRFYVSSLQCQNFTCEHHMSELKQTIHSVVQPWASCMQHKLYVINHYRMLWCRPAGHFLVLASLHAQIHTVCTVSVCMKADCTLSLCNSPFLTWADSRCRCSEEQQEKALRTSPHIKHLKGQPQPGRDTTHLNRVYIWHRVTLTKWWCFQSFVWTWGSDSQRQSR